MAHRPETGVLPAKHSVKDSRRESQGHCIYFQVLKNYRNLKKINRQGGEGE
jgi:hypothetical protein